MNDRADRDKSIVESIWLTLWTYLFMMCFALAIYTKGTYNELGNTKFSFYRSISIAGVILLCLLYVLLIIINKKKILAKRNIRLVDIAFLSFAITNLLTFCFAVDRQESLWGTTGWNMGFLTWCLMIFYYFSFSRFMKWKNYLWYIIFIPVFIVAFLAILNRFGVISLFGTGTNSFFLSTIGNINWYCGYLSVFMPLGICLFTMEKLNNIIIKCGLALWVIVCYTSAFSQGSTSIIVIMLATNTVLLLVCLAKRELWISYLIQLAVCGLSMEVVRFLVKIYGYNYEGGNLCISIVDKRTGLILMAVSFFLISVSRLLGAMNIKWHKKVYLFTYVLCIIGCMLVAIFLIINNFNEEFGNGRGFIWIYSARLFNELDVFRKLVGIGQDCYAYYSYSIGEYAYILDMEFGSARLTNAHNELFTLLINNGILGLLSYVFVLGAVVLEFAGKYKKDKNIFALAFLISLIAYTCNNFISFAQIMSTPYIFMLIGIGEAAVRDDQFNQDPE